MLTHLSGMAARCSRDMVVRRNIDAVVMQIRREIAEACSKAADAVNEPPLDEKDFEPRRGTPFYMEEAKALGAKYVGSVQTAVLRMVHHGGDGHALICC